MEKPEKTVKLISGRDVKTESPVWLWRDWLALGQLTILAGPSQAGKTSIAIEIAARLSAGLPMPDGKASPKCFIVIWSGEDSFGILKARYLAAGGDVDRLFFVAATDKTGAETYFDPATDIDKLDVAMSNLDEPILLIVDSIVSAVRGDMNMANVVRRALQPIKDLVDKHQAAFIGITHLAKNSQGNRPVERVIGSQAFGALPRSVWIAIEDSSGSERNTDRRVLVRSKTSYGAYGGGYEYRILNFVLHDGVETSRLQFGSHIEGAPEDIIALAEGVGQNAYKQKLACELLKELLKGGPKPCKELYEAAEQESLSKATLRRAKDSLGVTLVVVDKVNMWSLPESKRPISPATESVPPGSAIEEEQAIVPEPQISRRSSTDPDDIELDSEDDECSQKRNGESRRSSDDDWLILDEHLPAF